MCVIRSFSSLQPHSQVQSQVCLLCNVLLCNLSFIGHNFVSFLCSIRIALPWLLFCCTKAFALWPSGVLSPCLDCVGYHIICCCILFPDGLSLLSSRPCFLSCVSLQQQLASHMPAVLNVKSMAVPSIRFCCLPNLLSNGDIAYVTEKLSCFHWQSQCLMGMCTLRPFCMPLYSISFVLCRHR